MEIVKEMKIPAHYLFDVITQSVKADILKQTKKELSEEELEGFEYIKTFSNQNEATIYIEKFQKNTSYHYSTQTNKNKILVKYDITPITDETCNLKYSEDILSFGYMQKINDAIVGFIWSYLKKKKFNEMLRQIEVSYSQAE